MWYITPAINILVLGFLLLKKKTEVSWEKALYWREKIAARQNETAVNCNFAVIPKN